MIYRLDTVNLKSFVCMVLLQIYVEFELTVHLKHEMTKFLQTIAEKNYIKANFELTVFK